MTRGIHAIAPRRTRRPGAQGAQGAHAAVRAAGHDPRTNRAVRRASFAVTAALTTVALTTTAAVSLTGHDDTGSSTVAATAEPIGRLGAVAADPAVRSAAQKADAVLTDADYVTREGDLTGKERKRVEAAAHDLRKMLDSAGTADEATGSTIGSRQTTAASRSSERTSLAERVSTTQGGDTALRTAAASPTASTTPTNLAGTAAPAAELLDEDLPVLETPLSSSVDQTAAASASDAQDADARSAAKTSATERTPSAEHIKKDTRSLERIIRRADGDAVVSVKAGPTAEEIEDARQAVLKAREVRASRAAERAAAAAEEKSAARAADARAMARAAKDYGNGQIPSSVLCDVSWAGGEQLRCDAAAALEDLNRGFNAEFGRNLDLTDGYRSYAEQVTVSATKGGLAAVPGTSNHGWGQALDLSGGIESFGSAEHSWMVANAGKYGWKLPAWAQAGGSKPEAWHWEYGTSY